VPARAPTLIQVVRDILRTRHYSRRTEKAYVAWIRRYIVFHEVTGQVRGKERR